MQSYSFEFSEDKSHLDIVIRSARFEALMVGEFNKILDQVWSVETVSVRIDFSQVEFIDSAGVGAMLNVQKRLRSRESAVELAGVRPALRNILELLRLDRVFRIL